MELVSEIVDWLKNYSQENGNLCFVVGVSGGIDSAVVSTLCAKTNIETHIVSLPIHQKEEQLTRADEHINWLEANYSNVKSHKLDLSFIFETFKSNFLNYDKELAWANTKSRLRMVSLYQISSFYNGLVVGTGNKVEDFGVGFFTKYGDGGVDISPIADLTKTEVRKLGEYLGITENILRAKPTDGLWEDDRTDEDQIGSSYEDLEWVMGLIENEESSKVQAVLNYSKFNKQNKHKMSPIPVFKKKTNKINNINLFQEIFVESNPQRLEEYVFCINKNLNNKSITKLFLVVDEIEYNNNTDYFNTLFENKIIKNNKIELIKNNQNRFTFNKLLKFAKKLLPENSVVLVANLDIFIPDTEEWKNINKDFFDATDKKICLALARTEFVNENEWFIDEYAWKVGEFADCWGFRTPLEINENDFPYDVPVGFAPGCDNHMFVILSKKYDHVFNWAEKYKIFHYDIVRKPDVVINKRGKMIINEKTYVLPDHFLLENINTKEISPLYDWESLLNNIKKQN
jgi:NAD+ synthase